MEASYKDVTQFFLLLVKFMINLVFRAAYEMSHDFVGIETNELIDK